MHPDLIDVVVEKFLAQKVGDTASSGEIKIKVSRRKAMMFADNGQVDETGTFTLFGQIVS